MKKRYDVFASHNPEYAQNPYPINNYGVYEVFEIDENGNKKGDCLYRGIRGEGRSKAYQIAKELVNQDE